MKSKSFFNIFKPVIGAITAGTVVFFITYACGKDKVDIANLTGKDKGAIPGKFNLKIGEVWREKVDQIQAKIDGMIPGVSGNLTKRFSGDDDDIGDGKKLSDLLKVNLPGTSSQTVNQKVFSELKTLSESGKDPYFETVDTEKYVANPIYDPTATNDPNYSDQYYLDMIHWQDGIKSLTDAQIQAGVPIVVAVLDTGVYAEHEDLADVMWSYNGIQGYDAIEEEEVTESSDNQGHGTHVSGIIAGTGNNSKGIHGVGFVPKTTGTPTSSITEIMPVTVLNKNGGGTSDVIANGLKWAVTKHWSQKAADSTRANQKLIVNMSLGGPFEISGYNFDKNSDGTPKLIDDIFTYATQKNDVLIVVAAGNENCKIGGKCKFDDGNSIQSTYYYPCSYQNVLCVAASDHQDKLTGFSNRGKSVGIAAPGWQILSTVKSGEYESWNGTSMATPVTAGAAAVVWSMYPDLTADQLKQVLRKSSAVPSTITSEVESKDGRLDLKAALAYAAELKAASKTPDQKDPTTVGVSTSSTNVPTGDSSASPNYPDQEGRGKGSGQGCGVVMLSSSGPLGFLLWGLILYFVPIFIIRSKKK